MNFNIIIIGKICKIEGGMGKVYLYAYILLVTFERVLIEVVNVELIRK